MAWSNPSVTRSRPGRPLLRQLDGWGPQLVLVAAIAFLSWCTLTAIAKPGLQYDEALFVNAALGGDYAAGTFVTDRFLGVPTMVMPYSGALKSWLWAPVFELLGVSVTTIRLPALVILAATIMLAFLLARPLLGRWPAALLTVLMATDPAFMTMAKADWGPVAISAFLRVGALAAYLAWARTASVRWLWLLAAAIALGIFNKVDFLAFAVALAFATLVVDHRGIVERVRARPCAVLLPALALAAVLVVEYLEIYVPARDFPAGRSDAGLADRVSEVWTLFRTTYDGTALHQYMTSLSFDGGTAIAAVTVVVVVGAASLALWRLSRLRRPLAPADAPLADAAKVSGFLLLLLLAMTAILVATPEAVGPHHAALLWPLPALLGVSLVSAAARMPWPRARTGALVVVLAPLLWLGASQVRVAEDYRASFASDRAWSPIWTTEVYAVTDAVRRAAPGVDGVMTADWGIGNQLLALGGESVRTRLNDAWSSFAGGSQEAVDQVAAGVLPGRSTIVVFHAPGDEVMPGTGERAATMLGSLPRSYHVRELYRGDMLLAYVVDDRPRSR